MSRKVIIYYTVNQISTILELNVRTVRYHIEQGNLVAKKILNSYQISSENLDKFFDDYFHTKRKSNKNRVSHDRKESIAKRNRKIRKDKAIMSIEQVALKYKVSKSLVEKVT